MTNADYIKNAFATDRAARNLRQLLMKKDANYVSVFDKQLQEIRDRQIAFWNDRESEVVHE